jgi:hypothetical protein
VRPTIRKLRVVQQHAEVEPVDSKKIVVVALLCAAVALVACRRETRYEPLKLGAGVPPVEQATR